MLSKNKAKFIQSLQLKKRRQEEGCFVVEGTKSVLELVQSDFEVRTVVCTEEFVRENKRFLGGKPFEVLLCEPGEVEAMSALKTNTSALAVARMRPDGPWGPLRGLVLALDGVSDPGNLGAIVRTADWYGIPVLLASEGTTDFYNPKALQASMGGFCRVRVRYANLEKFLAQVPLPVYAAGAKGESAHVFPFEKDCVLVLGNEAHGVSKALLPRARHTIGIPAYGRAESLNVAAAAAVLCDNYRRLTAS